MLDQEINNISTYRRRRTKIVNDDFMSLLSIDNYDLRIIDDGINTPGLFALAQAMRNLGCVSILAPDRNWSRRGQVKTLNRPLRIREVDLEDGANGFSSDGAPSDCVALAMLGYFSEPIDLVVSGINPIPDLGHDVTYSGTVTAAMKAV